MTNVFSVNVGSGGVVVKKADFCSGKLCLVFQDMVATGVDWWQLVPCLWNCR